MGKKLTNYTFFWLTGQREVLNGNNPADAMNNAGYGNGALRALDFYAPGDNEEWEWDKKSRSWDKKEPINPQLLTTKKIKPCAVVSK